MAKWRPRAPSPHYAAGHGFRRRANFACQAESSRWLLRCSKFFRTMSPPTQDRRSPPRRKRKPLIYIVDDESLLLYLAEASLQTLRHKIRNFQDPEVALTSFLPAKLKTH